MRAASKANRAHVVEGMAKGGTGLLAQTRDARRRDLTRQLQSVMDEPFEDVEECDFYCCEFCDEEFGAHPCYGCGMLGAERLNGCLCDERYCRSCVADIATYALQTASDCGEWMGALCWCGQPVDISSGRSSIAMGDFDLIQDLEMERKEKLRTCSVCFDSAAWTPAWDCCEASVCSECLSTYLEHQVSGFSHRIDYMGVPCPSCKTDYSLPSMLGRLEEGEGERLLDIWRRRTEEATTNITSQPVVPEEEKKFWEWAKSTASTGHCPRCGVVTEKNGGCNHMICGFCGVDYNWTKAKSGEDSAKYKVVPEGRPHVWLVIEDTSAPNNAYADMRWKRRR